MYQGEFKLKLVKRVFVLILFVIFVIIVKVKQLKVEGYDVIGLGVGELDFNMFQYIIDVVVCFMNEGYMKYMFFGGLLVLKDSIVEKFKNDQGIEY